ncbi:hypothetical protein BN946_scf185003.g12 [Trametes cinnabarina]|uniref:Uncharacterized protein n=1 Tax=Pycnoporus cinnabarinus TaxID=5643 RepID=A0A060S1H1_PYCCI|nr:hypothetical protein BN946_scf185003.g12 [Trametes cinnabarina]
MVEDERDGPDLETLQAQIDMSMALTNNIVSSWMKSSKAKLPSSSSRHDDVELEEYTRRPARLGVGAAAPESTGVLGRETAKLRNKLTGQGKKKREREDDDAEAESRARTGKSGSGGTAGSDDDDDEDSRARVIMKKARVDPFAAKGGDSKKKKKKGDPLSVPASKPLALPPGPPPAADEKQEEAQSSRNDNLDENSPASELAPSLATSGAKKKKKKKHKAETNRLESRPNRAESADPAAQAGGEVSAHEKNVPIDVPPTVPTSASGGSLTALRHPGGEHNAVANSNSISGAALHQSASRPPVSPSKAASSNMKDPFGLPLLNLAGPPPGIGDGQSESPKKRRKRKKKKKKALTHPMTDADAIKVDKGDATESDDIGQAIR